MLTPVNRAGGLPAEFNLRSPEKMITEYCKRWRDAER